ncbi:TetR family transcriptional regulator [Bifidobacterium lemurum]|uniref:TetR family transcriptional regulator n=1 Tax=Bifidobacterium lemurum TaxID=1603886 RepID=A0A261FU87_9BIFI|nr:TetR family transcriptional regulator [Bifidobacterium lemurum]OZG62739.1 TetR family transcriptional regulator [Bifidobacterium lemurum]QOL34549.1 TetR/AcrR family transcriptional regulator [Bifidobacterium lemurum]
MSERHDDFRPIGKRVRMTAEERRTQIIEASVRLISRYGSYGFSMQSLADAVGLTLPGLGHYVKSREELLAQIIETYYDSGMDFLKNPEESGQTQSDGHGESGTGDRHPRNYPSAIREVVRTNAQRPELVSLFMRLAIEAADPHHPAHDFYVERHTGVLRSMMDGDWNLPEEYRDPERLHDLIVTVFFAMDGVQIQSLTNPNETMVELWDRAERVLFPSPTWDGYR